MINSKLFYDLYLQGMVPVLFINYHIFTFQILYILNPD